MTPEQEIIANNSKLRTLLASILLGWRDPLAPHNRMALVELFGYPSEEELIEIIRTGKMPKKGARA